MAKMLNDQINEDYIMRLIEGEIRPIGFPMVKGIKEAPLRSKTESLADSINGETFLANRDLPNPSGEEVTAFATRKILEPFKVQNQNGFGSHWNEITARAACQTLGLDHLKTQTVIKLLSQNTPKATRLKTRQAEIAALFEKTIEKKAEENQDKFHLEAAKIAWVKEKLTVARQILAEFPDLPKARKKELAHRAVAALIDFIHKFGKQSFSRSDFLRMAVNSMATNEPIVLLDIHCPPFKHTPKGIEVIPSAKDQQLKTAEGKTVIVSQWDSLEEIKETAGLLESNGIPCKIIVAIVDIDEFVLGDQTQAIDLFRHSLSEEIEKKEFKAEIELVSDLVSVPSLESPQTENIWNNWKKRLHQTQKLAMRLLDSMFERLQKTDLPSEMKTRQFATFMAGRRFVIHFLLGRNLPEIFPQGIIMLRARGSEVSEIDKLGAKNVGLKPFIIHHWRERRVLENEK